MACRKTPWDCDCSVETVEQGLQSCKSVSVHGKRQVVDVCSACPRRPVQGHLTTGAILKYSQHRFSVHQSGSSNYEQTFVRCGCDSGSGCCVKCESCGVKIRNGMLKWHECDPLQEVAHAMASDALLTVCNDFPESMQGMAEYMDAGGNDAV